VRVGDRLEVLRAVGRDVADQHLIAPISLSEVCCNFCAMEQLGDVHSADGLSDQEIISGIAAITQAESKSAAHKFALLAQFSCRGLNLKLGCSNPSHWLADGTRVARGNADRQFDTANWLTSWPTVIDALASGDIHSAHVKEIHDGYKHIRASDPTLSQQRIADAVTDLLDTAFVSTSNRVRERAQELGHAAADDARARYEEKRREQAQRRQQERDQDMPTREREDDDRRPDQVDDDRLDPPPLRVSENPALNKLDLFLHSNGRTTIRGDVDAVLAEKLRASLSKHSHPRPSDGARDPRSASKRNADALDHILDKNLRGQSGTGTSPTRVNVTVKLRDLLAKAAAGSACPSSGATAPAAKESGPSMGDPEWPFHLDWTGPISAGLARLLACDADLQPIILDDHGIPLAMGRAVRLATPEQRVAVKVRDRCCVKCGLPAQWCHIHHLVFWSNDGATDLTNLVLLCGDCHRDVHNNGWTVDIGDDGHPYVVPPASIDPERKPVPSYHRRRKPAA
jgi:hypothetical protein